MKKEINIVDILKDKPNGTKLYSPIFGECTMNKTETTDELIRVDIPNNFHYFNSKGNFRTNGIGSSDGECLLFPSNRIRDWSKFAWKKGDVLVSNDGKKNIIFVEFTNDTYTSFKGKYGYEASTFSENEEILATQDYVLADCSKNLYRCTIEERLGGKLDMETLEIEYNKPKCELKPFDKVVVRNSGGRWTIDFFSFKVPGLYACIGSSWNFCLPYNENTAKLIGTTNDYKED